MTRIGCIAATDSGREAAAYLAALWPDEVAVFDEGTVADSLRAAFGGCDAVVAFLATGATVRILAPLLGHKTTDAPVVCVDEGRQYAIALLGGHYGANDLARRVADVLGAAPVISNARDAEGIRPLPRLPERSEPQRSVLPLPLPPLQSPLSALSSAPALPRGELIVGVGASRGVSADEVLETVDAALTRAGLPTAAVAALATADLKADEAGILEAARHAAGRCAATRRRSWPASRCRTRRSSCGRRRAPPRSQRPPHATPVPGVRPAGCWCTRRNPRGSTRWRPPPWQSTKSRPGRAQRP